MAARKIYDLAVSTRRYTDRDGNEKSAYENVGSVLEMDDGGRMILLKRSFNPAGVPFKDGGDQIAISMFVPKEKDGNGEVKADTPKPKQVADFDDTPF